MTHIAKIIGILLLTALSAGCNKDAGNEPTASDRRSIAGTWEKVIDKERYVFTFEEFSDGSFRGSMTTYVRDKAAGEMPLHDIAFENLTVSMVTNQEKQIVFKGILDTLVQSIKGNLHYRNGNSFPFDLKRLKFPDRVQREQHDRIVPSRYKTIDQLPAVGIVPRGKMECVIGKPDGYADRPEIGRDDAVAVINRWHGDIYPDHPERSTALFLAFLLDPVTREVSAIWKERIANATSVNEKVGIINQWTTQNMAYTQAHPAFSSFPGNDPWGTSGNSPQPVFKKLIPPEMKAMKLHTGKLSGKCFTLVNLIMSSFVQLGVNPDDIIVLITKSDNARHAMGLVNYEGNVLLVNLMMIGLVEDYLHKDFGTYEIMGLYNLNFAQKVDIRISRADLLKIIHSDGPSLTDIFLNYFNLKADRMNPEYPMQDAGNDLYQRIISYAGNGRIAELTKYACQSLMVGHPEYFLHASLMSSGPGDLAKRLVTENGIFEWIASHIRYGSIFEDSGKRIMTADQVLVFQQGSYKDQAVLAWTLLKHIHIDSEIEFTADNAYVRLQDTVYDVKNRTYIDDYDEKIVLAIRPFPERSY